MAETSQTLPTADELYGPGAEVRVEFIDALGVKGLFDTCIHSTGDQLAIIAPDLNMTVRLLVGWKLSIIRKVGRDAYVSTVVVTGCQRAPTLLIFTTKPTDKSVEKQPRRRFFRVRVSMPFRSGVGSGTIVDASASGLLLETTRDLFRDGQELMLNFDLPSRRDVQVRVKVMRQYESDGRHYTGVDVISIRPALQDELIRFLLAQQRQSRK